MVILADTNLKHIFSNYQLSPFSNRRLHFPMKQMLRVWKKELKSRNVLKQLLFEKCVKSQTEKAWYPYTATIFCVSYILNAHLMSISLVAVWNAVLLHKCGQRYKRKKNTSASEQATYNWENRLLFATSRAHTTIKVSAFLCAGNIKLSGKSEMLETLILL